MKSTLWWLGLIFGTLSVVMLVKQGFQIGLVPALQEIVSFYDQVVCVLLCGLGHWIAEEVLNPVLGARSQLAPVWKHIFVLLLAAVSSVSRQSLQSGRVGAGVGLLTGALIALIVALLWGVFQLLEFRVLANSPLVGPFVALSPVFGLVLFDAYANIGGRRGVMRALLVFLACFVSLVCTWAAIYAFSPRGLSDDGSESYQVALSVWALAPVIGYALYLLTAGVRDASGTSGSQFRAGDLSPKTSLVYNESPSPGDGRCASRDLRKSRSSGF